MCPEENWLLAVFCLDPGFLVETAGTGYCQRQSLLNDPLCADISIFFYFIIQQVDLFPLAGYSLL